jgi:hypothetical protein
LIDLPIEKENIRPSNVETLSYLILSYLILSYTTGSPGDLALYDVCCFYPPDQVRGRLGS